MIINTKDVNHIYLSNQYVDMRKSINGLSLLVDQYFEMNVLDKDLFLFTNKARNRIKILYYESNGFWLLMKRIEHGKFKLFEDENGKVKTINERQLSWLLEGFEIRESKHNKNGNNRLII